MKNRLSLPLWFVLFFLLSCSDDSKSNPDYTDGDVDRESEIVESDMDEEEADRSKVCINTYDSLLHQAIGNAGGDSFAFIPETSELSVEKIGEILDEADCLLLSGGADIDPAFYGEKMHETVTLITKRRQELDFALFHEAHSRNMPILGICLGAQEINVALGGSLVQDIPSEIGDEIGHRKTHDITIGSNTMLESMYPVSVIEVVSLHHQAVDAEDLGESLIVSASANDGVVEAIESETQGAFILGLQYHPESQSGSSLHDGMWQSFIKACEAYRKKSTQD